MWHWIGWRSMLRKIIKMNGGNTRQRNGWICTWGRNWRNRSRGLIWENRFMEHHISRNGHISREYYNIAYEILKLRECSTEGRHMMNALHAAVIRTNKCKSTSLNTETNILFFNLYLLVFLTNTSRFKSFFPIIELLKRKKKRTKLKKIFCSKRENKLGIEKLETMLRKSMRTNKSFH